MSLTYRRQRWRAVTFGRIFVPGPSLLVAMDRDVRRAYGRILILALITLVALSGCGHGDPDPGGRILDALKSVEVALPEDATAVNRQFIAPKWDSCDARPETEGWSHIMVLIDFQTDLEPEALGEHAGAALEAEGWVDDGVVSTPLGPSWRWTRTLDDGTVARASLSPGMSDGAWNLAATAPPRGQQVSGC